MSTQSYKYIFKAILVGDTAVGKSCLLLQLIENEIRENHDVTIGVEFGAKVMKSRGENIKLQIWDTAGQENFRSITRSYYRSAAAAILVYDITSKESFDNIQSWVEEIEGNGNQNMVMVLVGNKSDLEENREVSQEEAQRLADSLRVPHVEASAKTAENVYSVFEQVVQIIQDKIARKEIKVEEDNPGIKPGNSNYSLAHTFNVDNSHEKDSKRKKKCC